MRKKIGLDVDELLSGPEGGDAQIAALVATAAGSACVTSTTCPLATNLATADLNIAALIPCPRLPADPA